MLAHPFGFAVAFQTPKLWQLFLLACWLAPATPCCAQQNLFNVPSAEITTPGDVFFQEQFNFNKIIQSNTTIDFGLPGNWEIGLNFLDVALKPATISPNATLASQVEPDFLVNLQKGFDLSDDLKLGIGTQFGQNVNTAPSLVHIANFSWITTVWDLPEDRGRFYVGPYFANHTYAGQGNNFGFMLGTEIPVVEERFHFIADYISGNSGVSVGVIGGVLILPGGWQLSLGAQVPSPGSGNSYGGVLELTRLPSSRSGKEAGDDDKFAH